MTKVYGLYRHCARGHYECPSDSHESLLGTSLSEQDLRDRFNTYMIGKAHWFRIPGDPQFEEGAIELRHNGSTGGGCSYIRYTLTIRPIEQFDEVESIPNF